MNQPAGLPFRVFGWLMVVVSASYVGIGIYLLTGARDTARFLSFVQAAGVEAAQDIDPMALERNLTANGVLGIGLGLLGLIGAIGLLRGQSWALPSLLSFTTVLVVLACYFLALLRTWDQVAQLAIACILAAALGWLARRSRRVA